ncbi:hypothetical protein LOTGIDRAFT_234719 [Lottia gigantea]|uniref:G kinase-anchoring protein 1 n=1 Tax=Lottia gigantea TaxID=225164 RepID=V3ZAY7_LOTGI|nr:hypothetical protein LOTGIDRAFT_234719 [Lottia gigantea]ESO88158.1 hypothetical protein LOTGIDRAFT_234719 [Lottia gigantea]
MARVQESRFAALMNDDKKSDKQKKNKKPPQQNQNQQQQQSKQTNKKNKKKSKDQGQNNNDQATGRQHLSSVNSNDSVNENTNNVEEWNQWVSRDAENTEEAYEKDLEAALLLSKLEIEEKKHLKKLVKTTENGKAEESNQSKKKKKKVMSLEEFKSTDLEHKESEKSESPDPVTPTKKIPPHKANDKYFDKVEDDVSKILRKEKIQEEYKKHYAQESVMASKYQAVIEEKSDEISKLKEQYEKLAEEHKKVKKRNKQLCFILAEGEMKDKTEVLLQVEELSHVKDELTDQICFYWEVAELTAELEKERSKVHSLKSELDKVKGKGK